jgi:hypothetical protein
VPREFLRFWGFRQVIEFIGEPWRNRTSNLLIEGGNRPYPETPRNAQNQNESLLRQGLPLVICPWILAVLPPRLPPLLSKGAKWALARSPQNGTARNRNLPRTESRFLWRQEENLNQRNIRGPVLMLIHLRPLADRWSSKRRLRFSFRYADWKANWGCSIRLTSQL